MSSRPQLRTDASSNQKSNRNSGADGESGEPLQPKIDGDPEFYGAVRSLLQNYFDLYGES